LILNRSCEIQNNNTHTLANITVTSDDSDLASKHDISGTLDTIDKGLPASIVVVKLGLRDRVVDIDSWDLQLPVAESLVQVVDTSSSLFRKTSDIFVQTVNSVLPYESM
jgi:hypothetical protein